jgi:hypothetical protein
LTAARNAYQRAAAEYRETLSDANKRLFDELQIINGQDAYSATAAALGKLPTGRYLALPNDLVLPAVLPEDVGTDRALMAFPLGYVAQVYALNKLRAPDGVDAAKFAALRTAAVVTGWANGEYETARVDPLPNADQVYAADLATMVDAWQTAKTAALLVPMVSEHVFRNYGHHYLTSDGANYAERYRKTLSACLAADVIGYLPPETLYYAALHWVTPARVRTVIKAKFESDIIPEAIRIRFNSAPAGFALITTTSAVIEAMKSANLAEPIAAEGKFDLAKIQEASELVKANSTRFHKTPQAYNVAPAPLAEIDRVELARAEATRFAPIAQGFIDAFLTNSPLGNAKALAKHADVNPVLKRRAMQFFRDLSRNRAHNVADLFAGIVTLKREFGE